MHEKTEQSEGLIDTLAEGIAAVMAAGEQLDETELEQSEEMADLFLEELNRLWAEGSREAA
ncbi:MAG: hypothetical protein ACTHNL_06920 [Devosia sp.]|jgi:hypothetical protein